MSSTESAVQIARTRGTRARSSMCCVTTEVNSDPPEKSACQKERTGHALSVGSYCSGRLCKVLAGLYECGPFRRRKPCRRDDHRRTVHATQCTRILGSGCRCAAWNPATSLNSPVSPRMVGSGGLSAPRFSSTVLTIFVRTPYEGRASCIPWRMPSETTYLCRSQIAAVSLL